MDDTTLNNVDNGPQVTIFKGVVKKLDQFLVNNRNIYDQSNDLPDKWVDQKRKTF